MLFHIFFNVGERLNGIPSEAAAQKLRGRVGTTVTVKVHTVSIPHLAKYFSVYTVSFHQHVFLFFFLTRIFSRSMTWGVLVSERYRYSRNMPFFLSDCTHSPITYT